jgi:hypothetical protein
MWKPIYLVPCKSGASAPRKAVKFYVGFSPRGPELRIRASLQRCRQRYEIVCAFRRRESGRHSPKTTFPTPPPHL